MEDNNKKNSPNNDDKISVGEQSVFDTLKQQNKQRKHEQLEFESQMTRQIAEENQKQRLAYEKKLQQDKIELLKMKQNKSDDNNNNNSEEQEEAVERTIGQKISSFFYLNKWWLGLFAMFALIAGFLIYDFATKKNPDTVILFFYENDDMDKLALRDYIEPFCEDFNDDGKIIPDVYYIPYTGDDAKDYSSGTSTKLMAEMQTDEAMIVICNKKCDDVISPEYNLVNLEELYPDKIKNFKSRKAEGVKECKAVLNEALAGKANASFIEGMGCVGGCVGGPKILVPPDKGKKAVDNLRQLIV